MNNVIVKEIDGICSIGEGNDNESNKDGFDIFLEGMIESTQKYVSSCYDTANETVGYCHCSDYNLVL